MPFYAWEAETCFLDTVDADKFCRVMEGRKGMLFVGECLNPFFHCTSVHKTTSFTRISNILFPKWMCSPIVLLGTRGT